MPKQTAACGDYLYHCAPSLALEGIQSLLSWCQWWMIPSSGDKEVSAPVLLAR
jgi:hypothetical protein